MNSKSFAEVLLASVCLGVQTLDDAVIALLPYLSGKLLDLMTGEEEVRAFAEDCVMFAAPWVPCTRCTHLQKTDLRKRKRKAEAKTIHPKCNKRYLSREEIQSQLSEEQKRKSEKREKYWKDKCRGECVEMEQEDHNDLNAMMGAKDEKDVPEHRNAMMGEKDEKDVPEDFDAIMGPKDEKDVPEHMNCFWE